MNFWQDLSFREAFLVVIVQVVPRRYGAATLISTLLKGKLVPPLPLVTSERGILKCNVQPVLKIELQISLLPEINEESSYLSRV